MTMIYVIAHSLAMDFDESQSQSRDHGYEGDELGS